MDRINLVKEKESGKGDSKSENSKEPVPLGCSKRSDGTRRKTWLAFMQWATRACGITGYGTMQGVALRTGNGQKKSLSTQLLTTTEKNEPATL